MDSRDLHVFFEGWAAAPGPAALLPVLRGTTRALVARDDRRVVGVV